MNTEFTDLSKDPKPEEPIEPDLNECCGNGCMPCVYDRYADERRAWHEAVKEWEKRHSDQIQP